MWQNVTGWQLLSWNSPRLWGTVLHILFLPLVSSLLYANEALTQPIIRRVGVWFIISCEILQSILTTLQGDVILGTGNCPLPGQSGSVSSNSTGWKKWLILERYLPMNTMMDRLTEIKVSDLVSCESGLWLDTQSFIIGYSYNNTSNVCSKQITQSPG